MRVGLVLSSTPSYSETFFRSKIRGLIDSGIEVVLFVKKDTSNDDLGCKVKVQPKISSSPILRLIQSLYYFILALLRSRQSTLALLKASRNEGYSLLDSIGQVIIAFQALTEKLDWLHFGFTTNALKRELIAKSIGAKMAVSLRGYDISVYPLKNPGEFQLIWKNLDRLHSISHTLLNSAYNEGLNRESSYKIITPAVNISGFINRKDASINSLLYVGRLHWIKGLEYLFNALSILKEEGVEFKLTLAGEGEDNERLRYCVNQLKLNQSVFFLGKVNHSEVSELMRTNSILVQYSLNEGFCNTVLEAQAAGMLCVVSDADGLKENVIDQHTGWVVKKRQPKLLADKLLEVMSLSELESDVIRKSAIKRVKKEFSLEKQKKEFIDFYSD